MANRILLFDIGNTLIVDKGDQPGKMMEWPTLQAVDGAVEALKIFSQQFPCFAVSNALDSDNDAAMLALERAGFSGSIRSTFTQRSLGCSKENPEFYLQVLKEISALAGECLMVGDDLQFDVQSAAEAGLLTCHYNPFLTVANSAYLPIQNAEFSHFSQLPVRVTGGIHPSVGTCLGWLVRFGATQGILQHVMMVSAVTYDLALRLIHAGEVVDPILAHRGALLHDIDKLHPDSSRDRHGLLGAEILSDLGYKDLANIVRFHVPPLVWDAANTPQSWEEKLVFYADKLVDHSQIVTLTKRVDELLQRYPTNLKMLTDNLPHMRQLENDILQAIDETPEGYSLKIKPKIEGLTKLPGKSHSMLT